MPNVIGEVKRQVEEREPPGERAARHRWLSDKQGMRYAGVLKAAGFFELYISKVAEEKIRNHCLKRKDREVMGFLMGDIYESGGKMYALARDIATTDLDADSVSVRFSRDRFEKLFEGLDSAGGLIVGWYHSHPGHGCFMSETDVRTQKAMFSEDFHAAVVVDPVKRKMAAYKLKPESGYREIAFAIYWDELQEPYAGDASGSATEEKEVGYMEGGEEIDAGKSDKRIVRPYSKYEFPGVLLYMIGAIMFSFIPLGFDIMPVLVASVAGLAILVIGLIMIVLR